MSASRTKLVVAVVVAAGLAAALFLGSTVGMRSLQAEPTVDTGPGNVPEFIYNAAVTVPTTEDYGPVGPVALVYPAGEVVVGLNERLANPWIAVSSQDGRYRALTAPHRPEPELGAVSVSADGSTLAWGFDGGVVVYDAVADQPRELAGVAEGRPHVGPFTPDGRYLTLHDGALRVLDLEEDRVTATLSGVSEQAARQAVWTRDGTALTYVTDGQLVTHRWKTDAVTAVPAPIAADATLAWQPAGKQLAALRDTRGVKAVDIFDVARDGSLELVNSVKRQGYAIQELLGFTTDSRVAVQVLALETSTIPLVYQMSTVDDAPPVQLMQMPGGGENWVGPEFVEIAEQPLSRGSADFEKPPWPWRDLAKLVSSIIVAIFALGLYLTRRPPKHLRSP